MAGGGCTWGLLEHSSKPFSSSRAFSCFTCLKSDSLFPETANTSSSSGPGTLSMLGAQPSSSSRSPPCPRSQTLSHGHFMPGSGQQKNPQSTDTWGRDPCKNTGLAVAFGMMSL